MIFLTVERWNKIRDQFTEPEKDKLNLAIVGESICPRAGTLDPEKLGVALTRKLKEALETTK